MNVRRVASCAAAVLAFAGSNAHANTITADGVTYSLTATAVTSTTDQFTLTITGINAPADTEKGRIGFDAIAFGTPAHFMSATTSASGFTEQGGGLNANGCNGNGAFFCFSSALPTGPALSANSTLSFAFNVTLSSGSFAGYVPDFKIDWIGSKNNYDLVSDSLTPTFASPVPGPVVGAGLPGLLMAAGGLFGLWRRKRSALAA
jgi:hypothetical protein